MTDQRAALRNFYLNRQEVFLGKVDSAHIDEVIADLIRLTSNGEGEVTLVITSSGGDTEAGFRLAQFIEQELIVPVTARIWGKCHSAATYPLVCCKKRIAHPQSTFLLHRQDSGIETSFDKKFSGRIKEWKSHCKNIHQHQVDFYSRKLGLKKKKVEKILLNGTRIDGEMSAVQAIELGLITEISNFK